MVEFQLNFLHGNMITNHRHTFLFSSASSSTVNLLIQERSRSVKSIFTVQRLGQPSIKIDNGATFFDTSAAPGVGGTLQNYQYRVGGRFPTIVNT